MGLDMMLYKMKRFGKATPHDIVTVDNVYNYDWGKLENEEQEKLFKHVVNHNIHELQTEVGYWRKANAIHNWFVNNVQNGVDDCGAYEVTYEQFEELRDICRTVINHMTQDDYEVAMELLPTVGGFFFGSTEYDDWYQGNLFETINIIDEVLDNTDFETEMICYQSSW